jgi:hypothetical protein
MIRIQQQAFDPGHELAEVKKGRPGIGGTVMFLGTVRDLSDGNDVKAMTLEHYPGMTEKALEDIEQEAHRRWPLDATLIIHRYGRLEPGDGLGGTGLSPATGTAAASADGPAVQPEGARGGFPLCAVAQDRGAGRPDIGGRE